MEIMKMQSFLLRHLPFPYLIRMNRLTLTGFGMMHRHHFLQLSYWPIWKIVWEWTEKRVAYDGLDDDLKEKADKLYEEELNKNEKSDIILNPAVMYLPEDAGYEKIYDNVKKV